MSELRVGRRRNAVAAWSVALIGIAACGAEQGGGNPFDSVGGMTTAPPAMAGDDGDDGGTTEGSPGDVDDEETSGAGTMGGDAVGSTGEITTGGSSGDGDPGNGMPPGGWMYGDCMANEQCGGFPGMCLTIQDQDLNPIDGFCTTTCTDPLADCDASPVATSTPVCMPTMVNGMADAVCALSCSGGAGCPAGMTCYNFGAAGEVCG
jgi:hypothetical protein